MISKDREKIKKIYDETATLIVDLALKQNLSGEEMHFLLNLLELIVVEKKSWPLTKVLHGWLEKDMDSVLDEKIKKLLLDTDLKSDSSRQETVENIRLLLAKYEEELNMGG